MKCKFVKFSPLKSGGITVMLETGRESLHELVTLMEAGEIILTVSTPIADRDDRDTILRGLRDAAQQIADAVNKELIAVQNDGETVLNGLWSDAAQQLANAIDRDAAQQIADAVSKELIANMEQDVSVGENLL